MSDTPDCFDAMELAELRAERWADENYLDGQFRCAGCREWFDWGLEVQSSPDPFSPAICHTCAGAKP